MKRTLVKSLTVSKSSGVAGSSCLYEANSTDTDCAGFMGPTALSDNTSYVGQLPTAGPTSANMVQAWGISSSGSGTTASPYVHPTSWIDLDDYATLTGTQTLTNKTISTGSVVPVTIGIACSDESTALTTGTAKATFRMPHAMTLTSVRASVGTAPTGATIQVDINEGGTSIFSTVLSIDASEKTSTTAATAAVISDSSLADDAEITIDIDQIGSSTAGAGLKVWLIGTRTL